MSRLSTLYLSQLRVWEVNAMKKGLALLIAALLLLLTACSGQGEEVELHVFAAASLTEVLDKVIEDYKAVAPEVTVVPTYDSSGTLLRQIQEGAACDVFLSAAQKQMEELDEAGVLLAETRLDLLENKVVLAVPPGNPKGVESFDQLAELLEAGEVFLAVGNSDVPVGQYTQRLFEYYGLEEAELGTCLSYGSNVKEVTTHVTEGSVDCGIIYATDAATAGLEVVDTAGAEQCGQVVYPAAVLRESVQQTEAEAFLGYLTTARAGAEFEAVGFTVLN